MDKKIKLGKVINQRLGYKVRIMFNSTELKSKSSSGGELSKTVSVDSGKLGVYAGKKLIKENFSTVLDAFNYINSL